MFRRVLPVLVSGALLAAAAVAMQPAAVAAEEAYVVPPGGVFDLTGKGFGHGHGMSQYGAKGRGEAGQSLTSILGFYYPGTAAATRDNAWLSVILTNSGAEGVKPATGNTNSRYQCDYASTSTAVNCGVQIVAQPGLAWRARVGGTWASLPTTLGGSTVTMWSVKRVENNTKLMLWGQTSAGPKDFVAAAASGFALTRTAGPSTTQVLYKNGTRVDYLGEIHLVLTAPTLLARINAVRMESYLRGVVPREMPAGWHPTGLQAQAVAARTYATWDEQHAGSRIWDTCDSTFCQMYRGVYAKSPSGAVTKAEASTDKAVSGTAGKIRTYGSAGQAAFTQFSASNGGYMSAGSPPYLAAAPDPYDKYPAWTATLTAAALQKAYTAVGTLDRLVITNRDGKGTWGGRILSARLEGHRNGTATKVAVTGDALRSVAGLRSTYVTVVRPVTDPHDRFGAAGLAHQRRVARPPHLVGDRRAGRTHRHRRHHHLRAGGRRPAGRAAAGVRAGNRQRAVDERPVDVVVGVAVVEQPGRQRHRASRRGRARQRPAGLRARRGRGGVDPDPEGRHLDGLVLDRRQRARGLRGHRGEPRRRPSAGLCAWHRSRPEGPQLELRHRLGPVARLRRRHHDRPERGQ
jgi:SpoIID/LytB domain protein